MMPVLRILPWLLLLVACGDDRTASSSPDAAPPEIDAPVDAPPDLISFRGTTFSFDPDQPVGPTTQPVLAGVEVCIVEGAAPGCSISGADGSFSVAAPKQAKLQVTFAATGHLPIYLFTETTDEPRDFTMYLAGDAIAGPFYTACGGTFPEANGGILLQGYRFTPPSQFQYLDGAVAGSSAGVGPCYFDTPYVYDPQQLTTSTAGFGAALFANIPTTGGSADVTLALAGTTCKAFHDLVPSPAENTLRVPLRAGFQTILDVVCE
jgi:hypothetical protein